MKLIQGAIAAAIALAISGCCGNKDHASPDSSSSPGAANRGQGTGTGAGSGIGTGTINAKKTATNQTGRGIVRTAPNFQASEVTRLDPGTQVIITATAPGGWYAISWPAGKGFIHGDVMQVSMN